MKSKLYFLTLSVAILVLMQTSIVLAQGDQFYLQKEQKARPEIKQKLQNIRHHINSNKLSFEVGYTDAMDMSLDQLAGLRVPQNLEQMAAQLQPVSDQALKIDTTEAQKFTKLYPGKLPELHLKCNPSFSSWDWRKEGKVTHVRNQGGCGSCWAFATIGAFESSYLIRNKIAIDSSEQCVLNCSGVGSCSGGWWAFDFLISNGTAKESDYPYTAHDAACNAAIPHGYKAVVWGYVCPSSPHSVPSVAELKSALCQHGPLAVAVRVTSGFQAYTGGVFNENDQGNVNHGVTLIGWDDSKQAWIIKNSWGTGWGSTAGYGSEKGYMYIHYNSNKIGYAAAWVKAVSTFYILPPNYYKVIEPIIKPIPEIRPVKREFPK